jgi:hypothetical protein
MSRYEPVRKSIAMSTVTAIATGTIFDASA